MVIYRGMFCKRVFVLCAQKHILPVEFMCAQRHNHFKQIHLIRTFVKPFVDLVTVLAFYNPVAVFFSLCIIFIIAILPPKIFLLIDNNYPTFQTLTRIHQTHVLKL